MADKDITGWITVQGRRVPIRKGQSKKEAISHSLKGKGARTSKDELKMNVRKDTNKKDKWSRNLAGVRKGSQRIDEVYDTDDNSGHRPRVKEYRLTDEKTNKSSSHKSFQDAKIAARKKTTKGLRGVKKK